MKFRKKPVIIDAVQWSGENYTAMMQFMGQLALNVNYPENTLVIPTLEGQLTASPLDWIIKGVKGEFYPCKPDIFELTYDEVEITIGEAANAKPQIADRLTCLRCSGHGWIADDKSIANNVTCPECDGEGSVRVLAQSLPIVQGNTYTNCTFPIDESPTEAVRRKENERLRVIFENLRDLLKAQ